ncbi:NAD-P-binding protein [Mytilinidion resinicola]|uniref:NAD-P-binding protein n=1 Tax=Mytilinidion resinicola TaxID=574789 RepID=A0A6A6Y2R1_9PEZI|nr:NAD-P-binding protein [Mytilinidion resinicola]KAF2803082.1 NAD-P-binding protein [Mytilinidion resinicola]
MDLSLNLTSTHVVVTGGAGLIGRVVCDAFAAAGARVSSLDIAHGEISYRGPNAAILEIHCDISDPEQVAAAFETAYGFRNMVHCCVALGSLDLSVLEHTSTIAAASFEQMKRVLDVNVAGTWLTAREWLRGLKGVIDENRQEKETAKNVGLIIVGSESGWFGERGNADYAMAKSAVQGGLLMSLKADAPRVWEGARVNAIAPGAVDTERFKQECQENPEQYWLDCQGTTALRKPVSPEAVAKTILFLASENFSGRIHGQVLNVDSGKQGKVMWTKEECK